MLSFRKQQERGIAPWERLADSSSMCSSMFPSMCVSYIRPALWHRGRVFAHLKGLPRTKCYELFFISYNCLVFGIFLFQNSNRTWHCFSHFIMLYENMCVCVCFCFESYRLSHFALAAQQETSANFFGEGMKYWGVIVWIYLRKLQHPCKPI